MNDNLARLITYYLLDNAIFAQIAKDVHYENMLDSGIEEIVKKSHNLTNFFDKKTRLKIVKYLHEYQKFISND